MAGARTDPGTGVDPDGGTATPTEGTTSGGDAGTATGAPNGTAGTPRSWTGGTTALAEKDGGPPPVTTGWHTFGYSLANTNYPETAPAPAADLGRYWRQYIEGQYSVPQPAVVDDTVYTGSGEYVYALAVDDGAERWSRLLGPFTHNVSPTVADGRVFVGARDVPDTQRVRDVEGSVYALDAGEGSTEWQVDAHVVAGSAVHEDVVYLPCTPTDPSPRGVLRALDAESGGELWQYEVAESRDSAETAVFATPAIDAADGTLYMTASRVSGEERGFLVALDVATGEERWRVDVPGPARVAPVVADGRVYVGDASGRLSAVTTDGESVWSVAIGDGGIDATPVVAAEKDAICATSVGRFACLSASTGEVTWTRDVRDVRRAGLAAADETLYVGGHPFLVVDLETGETRRAVPVEGEGGAYGQPVVTDGAVYVTSCIKEADDPLYDNYVYVMG